ncbi:Fe(3+)-siderophore ABC transporter permease [Brenneria corticis]
MHSDKTHLTPMNDASLLRAPFKGKITGYPLYGLLIVSLLLMLCSLLSLFVGAKHIPFTNVINIFSGDHTHPDSIIILEARLPRMLAGLLAGAALGVSGALIQALTRNPLADPGILGINAGASFAVVIGIAFFGATLPEQYLWFAFGGALLSSLGVWLIAFQARGKSSPVRLTLAGVALGAVLAGMTSGISLMDPQVYDQARFWEAGTLDIRSMHVIKVIAIPVLAGLALALLLARSLNVLDMGDDMAQALGTRTKVVQMLGLIAITLLCGSATAAVGPIAFIGLMVPHIARRLVGPDQRQILPWVMILTPGLLLISDMVGRVIVPGELRVSIVTAFIGSPVLIALVRRHGGKSG